MTDEQVSRVRLKVRRLRDFYMHLAIYVVVMGGLALLNWAVWPDFWWVIFPAIAWGIGVVAHGVSVLFEDRLFGREWEDRKTRELMEREVGHTTR